MAVHFADDYLHFGLNNPTCAWLEGIFQAQNAISEARLLYSNLTTDSTAVAKWRLTIRESEGVIVDSTFVGENLVKRNGHWLLRGNQLISEPPAVKQRVIIEYFTFLGCPNCPAVEAELHNLQLAYPGQLSYLEHHISGPLTVSGDETYDYYGLSPCHLHTGRWGDAHRKLCRYHFLLCPGGTGQYRQHIIYSELTTVDADHQRRGG